MKEKGGLLFIFQQHVETPTVICVSVCQTTYKVEANFGSEELTIFRGKTEGGKRNRTSIHTAKSVAKLRVKLSPYKTQILSSVQSVILLSNQNTLTSWTHSVSVGSLQAKLWGAPSRKQAESHPPETKMISLFCNNSSWIYTRLLLLCPLLLFYHLFLFFLSLSRSPHLLKYEAARLWKHKGDLFLSVCMIFSTERSIGMTTRFIINYQE